MRASRGERNRLRSNTLTVIFVIHKYKLVANRLGQDTNRRGFVAKARKKRDQRERKRDRVTRTTDRNVPISPTALRVVMTDLGVTVSELARRSGNSQQAIDAILSADEGRQTRTSRRASLAKALDVADEVLVGAGDVVLRGAQLSYEYGYSAHTWYLAQRLLTKCDQAAHRDVLQYGPPLPLDEGDGIRRTVQEMIADLMMIGSWRERFLEWKSPRSTRHPRQRHREPLSENPDDVLGGRPVKDPAHERGVIALIRAIEHLLTPWFEEKAFLDYTALREFTTSEPASHTTTRCKPHTVLMPAILPPQPEAS